MGVYEFLVYSIRFSVYSWLAHYSFRFTVAGAQVNDAQANRKPYTENRKLKMTNRNPLSLTEENGKTGWLMTR